MTFWDFLDHHMWWCSIVFTVVLIVVAALVDFHLSNWATIQLRRASMPQAKP